MAARPAALAITLGALLWGGAAAGETGLHDIVPRFDAGPGCALAAHRRGERIAFAASGLADIERGSAIDGDTLFYAASVSKQFTALAIAQLTVQGRLSLDDDVRLHVPELPVYRNTVTVRMLLNHSAGLRDSLSLLRLGGHESVSRATMAQALELQLAQQDTNFPPGTSTAYSNGGYLLLAEIVHRVSGEGFADYVKRHILEPLGMSDSFVLDGAAPASGHLAGGYVLRDSGFERRDTYPRFGGSGGLMLTLNDLARYEYDIEQGHRVWTPDVARIMTEAGSLADGSPAFRDDTGFVFAAGLMLGTRLGHPVIQHGGGAEAFRHLFVRLPEQGLGIAFFCNRSDQPVQEMMDAAIAALVGPAPGFAAEGPSPGRYRSGELLATYYLSGSGNALQLKIVRDEAAHEPHTVELLRREAGRYEGSGITLLHEAGERGFRLETSRARAIAVAPDPDVAGN